MASNTALSPRSADVGTPALRLILRIDALACAASGALIAVGSPWLTDLLGYPVAFLVGAGVFLVAFAGFLAWLAARERVGPAAVQGVVAGNAAWVAASVLLVAMGAFSPTVLGIVAVLTQAAALVPITAAEALTLRRAR